MTESDQGLDPQVDNPQTTEQRIQHCIQEIERAPRIIEQRLRAWQDAKLALDQARAKAEMNYDGSLAAKKNAGILATVDLQQTCNDAHALYQYARERAKALQAELSGRQTINRSVGSAYGNSGYGR